MNANGGFARVGDDFVPKIGFGFHPSSLGLPEFLNQSLTFPSIGIDGMQGLGAGGATLYPTNNLSFGVDLTKVHGSHTISWGFTTVAISELETAINPVNFGFDRSMSNGPDPTTGIPDTGYGFSSFLLGTGGGNYNVTANGAYMKHWNGWYLQDDWKVTSKLVLNLGVRYDFQTAPTERFNRMAYFQRTVPNPLTGIVPSQYTDPNGVVRQLNIPGHLSYVGDPNRRGDYIPQYSNIAPRIGLGYRVTDKLVMRAGFGMFYSSALIMAGYQGLTLYGFSTETDMVGTVDGITPHDLMSNPFPNGLIQPVGKADGTMTQVGQSMNAFVEKRPTPYMEQWMWDAQYGLTSNDTIDLIYMGNHGVKLNNKRSIANQLTHENQALGNSLLQQVNNPFYGYITNSACGLDQPTITWGQLLRPYPEYCSITDRQQPGFSSWYDALEVNYNHRWSRGLQMSASFTWSKYLDNTTGIDQNVVPGNWTQLDTYDRMRDKSLDHNDMPKSLAISAIYELPVGRGRHFGSNMNKVADGVLGGWQFSTIGTFKDGFPLAIGANDNTGSLGGTQRPDCVGNPNIPNPTADMWLNTDAFAQPAPFTFGSCSRTMPNLRNMGTNNWDMNIHKVWTIREQLRIQFRAEAYNAFNRTYLTRIDQSFGSSTFGQAYEAGAPRSIQFGMKVNW
jgi:outer membrane receptor protein involved in Fe transport